MNCFKKRSGFSVFNSKKHKQNRKNNELNVIFKKFGKSPIKIAYDHQKLGELILEKIIDSYRNTSNINNHINNTKFSFDHKNNVLILELLESNIVDVNSIKNFLNQTLLHFACENNDLVLCKYLMKYGADCLLEDNYRQTPFILAAKLNSLELLDIFIDIIKSDFVNNNKNNTLKNLEKQIRSASYHACDCGNLRMVKQLFEKFDLKSESLIKNPKFNKDLKQFIYTNRNFELNIFHVACYKGNTSIVEFLMNNAQDVQTFINSPINDFRSSTSLEEALKGFIILYSDINNMHERDQIINFYIERRLKSKEYHNIINLLIENKAKFSKNFIQNNGLSKLISDTFSGPTKDIEFVNFLYCFSFLFKFKLKEIFYYNEKNFYFEEESKNSENETNINIKTDEYVNFNVSTTKLEISCKLFDLEKTIDDFLLKIYLISQRVIKDHKRACLNKYIELLFILHYSGQSKIKMSKLNYLKEKNSEIYGLIWDNVKKPLSLKWCSVISIRNSINDLGMKKISSLNIPDMLKEDLFLNNIPIIETIQNSFCTYLF